MMTQNKTYAETKGEKPFDWWDALNNNPEERQDELLGLASSWVTCACGNLCDVIPRGQFSSAPIDDELRSLGRQFERAIFFGWWEYAKIILGKIEVRSGELIRGLVV